MNASTALALVNTIQSNASGFAAARSSGSGSSGGAIRIMGASMDSAPRAVRRSTSSGACSRGRVTRTRFPNS